MVEINGDNLRYASEKRRREIEAFLEREGERPVAEQNVVFNGSYHPNSWRRGCRGWTGASCRRCGGRVSAW